MFFSSGAAQTNGGGSLCMAAYSFVSYTGGKGVNGKLIVFDTKEGIS